MLAHTLLPTPDSFTVTDRQRASANGYLLDGTPVRNYADLQRLLPYYAFVPARFSQRFANYTPNKFGIGRQGRYTDLTQQPFFSLLGSVGGSIIGGANGANGGTGGTGGGGTGGGGTGGGTGGAGGTGGIGGTSAITPTTPTTPTTRRPGAGPSRRWSRRP